MSKQADYYGTVPEIRYSADINAKWDAEEEIVIAGSDTDLTTGNIDNNASFPRSKYYAYLLWNLSTTDVVTVKYKRIGFSASTAKTAVLPAGLYMRVMPLATLVVSGTTTNANIKICYKDRAVYDGVGAAI